MTVCCSANHQDFCVGAGETFHPVIRWGIDTLVSVPITAITQAAPAVITATAHGLPDGWPCAVVSAQGMVQINASRYPPEGRDWTRGTVLNVNTVQLNAVSSADFTPYLSGGFLVYSQPASLVGVSARMTFWDNPEHIGTPLVTLVSGVGITLDPISQTLAPLLQTAGLAWRLAYYSLEATDGGGIVTELLEGTLTID